MLIKIDLKDTAKCSGCPLLSFDTEQIYVPVKDDYNENPITRCLLGLLKIEDWKLKPKRPKTCISKYGK
jgi:hypothetical protein